MFKSVLVVLVAVCFCKTSCYENKEYETLLTKIMDEDWEQGQRFARNIENESASSGCQINLVCESSVSMTCEKVFSDCSCNCSCNPGYKNTASSGNLCEKTKQFGGTITFDVNDTITFDVVHYCRNETGLAHAINKIYEDDNYIECEIVDCKSGSGSAEVDYILYYKNVVNVTNNTVMESFKGICDCKNTTKNCSSGYPIIRNGSCDTIIDDSVLCLSDVYTNYCNLTSTNCTPMNNGYVECTCKDGLDKLTKTSCYEPVCKENSDCNDHGKCIIQDSGEAFCDCEAPYGGINCEKKGGGLCEKSGDCNHPFGWCEEQTKTCTCMWGFQGAHCYEPWLFTLTVVASGCTLIIIILLNVAICCSQKKSKKELTTKAEPMDDLTNPFTDFQPGIMRAKVPGRSIYSNLSDPMPKPANGNGVATSSFNGQHERSEIGSQNGHVNSAYTNSNYGYASIDKTRKQSGYGGSPNRNSSASYGSPKRGSNDYF